MGLELAANISLMFTEVEYHERPAAAAASGFEAVETWWPFESAEPSVQEIDRFVGAIDRSGIPLTGLNLYAGDLAAGWRGLVSRPDRQDEFDTALDVIVGIAARTGCRVFNALYGQRRPGLEPCEQDATGVANLVKAVARLGDLGGVVLVEPLTIGSAGKYPIHTSADAAAVVEQVRERGRRDEIGILFDTFHLANNGEDLLASIDEFAGLIAHVQLADTPGRGEPGSGTLPFAAIIDRLWACGYRRMVACEYVPTTPTVDTLDWRATIPLLG